MVKTDWFQAEAATTWEGLNNARHWICFHKLGRFKQRAVLAVWTPKVWKQERNNSRGSGRQSLLPSSSFWRFCMLGIWTTWLPSACLGAPRSSPSLLLWICQGSWGLPWSGRISSWIPLLYGMCKCFWEIESHSEFPDCCVLGREYYLNSYNHLLIKLDLLWECGIH